MGHFTIPAGLKDGDVITAVRVEPKVVATVGAFALWCAEVDGSELPWGDPGTGGDSSAVDQLRNVQQVGAAWFAYAAILGDGSVVTWGDARFGGDSSTVQAQLRNVKEVEATQSAFAAILADGSVVTWGDPTSGGDSSTVQDQLMNVQQIRATGYAFGGDSSEVRGDGSIICSALETSNRCSGYKQGICCHPSKWLPCDMGRSILGW
jgi:hypothetical protein